MLGGRSEGWPSRGVHLRCVKQVHSVLISYGHQVLSHLGEHKNWDWERETVDKFQLHRGRAWRARCREDNTVEIISNNQATLVPRYQVCGIWNISIIEKQRFALTVFSHKSNMSEDAPESTSNTNRETTERSPHQRSVIQKSPRCLDERRDTDVCFVSGGENRDKYFSCLQTNSPNPRQETRRPDFPRFLWKKKERKKESSE